MSFNPPTVPPSQSGTTPSLYADCIWATDMLPAYINGLTNQKLPVSGVINGITYNFADPENQIKCIQNIDLIMSLTFYGAVSGFYSTNLSYPTNYPASPAVSVTPSLGARPCRYVIMHAPGTPNFSGSHQLQVDAAGNSTFINTTWTA